MIKKLAFYSVFILGVTVGSVFGGLISENAMKEKAVSNGFAHYHYKTGKWMWGIPVQPIEQDEIGMFLGGDK